MSRSRRRSNTKPRSECDEGIWLGVWVTFYRKCYIPLVSHQNLEPYPASAKASHFCLFASLNPQKFDCAKRKRFSPLRMTYRMKQTGDRLYYVYILASKANAMLYIGVTNNLSRRLREHKNGEIEGFTKTYGIHKLVFFEEFSDINDAITCEKRLKRWTRAKKRLGRIKKSKLGWP